MTIILNPEQENFIREKLESGKYSSAEEVIMEAFQLLEKRDKHYERWLETTRSKVAIGLEQLDRGEAIDGSIVINQLKEKLHQIREAQS